MKICLAPMDWVTNLAYRVICKEVFQQHGAQWDELRLRTEFMSADGYHHNPAWVVRHAHHSDFDPETILQIFGGNWDTLVSCAVDCEKKYWFWWIELNMWCPSPKIMKCAAGSWMLRDKERTLDILRQISQEISLPFSLKTRIWLSPDDVKDQFEFLIKASEYVSMIGVHWRTYKQSHSWFVDRDFMYNLKKELPNTIVTWNWWLRSYQDCVDLRWNLDWMMIGQSAIWNPRILTPHTPNHQEVFSLIFNHLHLSIATEYHFRHYVETYDHTIWLPLATRSELDVTIWQLLDWQLKTEWFRSPVEFRWYLFNYISGLPWNKEVKRQIARARDYISLRDVLVSFAHDLWVSVELA